MSGMAQTRASGILFALSAGILWGFVPVYINFFGNVDPLEIVAHRSLWSLVMLFGIGDVATANQHGTAGFRQQKTTFQFYNHHMFFIGKLDSLCVCGAIWPCC